MSPPLVSRSSPRRVVFIMCDTQRADMLGCYGTEGIGTPNLDALAAQGLRFDQAYCCSPVCGPARSALFTGMHAHANGSWANSMPLGQTVLSLGQRLQAAGIPTAYTGKWHLDGHDYFGSGECPPGWDPEYWYEMRNYLEELTPEERVKSRDPGLSRQEEVPDSFTYAHRCTERALRFLESPAAAGDFLLVISYDEPHHPYLTPRRFVEQFEDFEFPKCPNHWAPLDKKPEHVQLWGADVKFDPDQDAIRAPEFFGCNAFVDHEVGRLLARLEETAPDALVIYTADHGDMLFSHGIKSKGPAMYQEITRVPLLMRWPGHIAPGGGADQPVSHIDLVPTILEVLGVPVHPNLHGHSLLATLAEPSQRVNEHIFIEFNRFGFNADGFGGGLQPIRAVHDGRHKLVINLFSQDELYDLAADPWEMENQLENPAYQDIRDRLHDRLLEWMNETCDGFRGYVWERRPWRTDRADCASWHYHHMQRQRAPEAHERELLDYATGLPPKERTFFKL